MEVTVGRRERFSASTLNAHRSAVNCRLAVLASAGFVSEVRLSMPHRSKWESLPTEAINPSTLAIDKLSAGDIVEGMLNEDRKMLAAVQREKARIADGVDIITQSLRKSGRIIFVGAGTSGR